MSRDPKIDPAPGDTLCMIGSRLVAVVDTADALVSYFIRGPGVPEERVVVPIEEWRRCAVSSRIIPLAERIAMLEKERWECEQRVADVTRQLAFLRGES